eukprot:GHVQ01038507.1.p1 GENE.GHVQ01038507.1~~GHVQ01038507.1.p1  ORF type:complete len:260 (-),score=15.52 GHVQ01038507.1:904-1683(-)
MLCVTKVDDIQSERERIKVMCQTTQSLTSKISSRHGFDLIPIYVPGGKDGSYLKRKQVSQDANRRPSSICVEFDGSTRAPVNRIQDIVEETEKLIDRKVQHTLNTLKDDCRALGAKAESMLEDDKTQRTTNRRLHQRLLLLRIWCLVGFTVATVAATLHLICLSSISEHTVDVFFGTSTKLMGFPTEWIAEFLRRLRELYAACPYVFPTMYFSVALFELNLIWTQVRSNHFYRPFVFIGVVGHSLNCSSLRGSDSGWHS